MSLPTPGDPVRSRPTLFILGDSISIQYGPYLERMLADRYTCDRKGSELLRTESLDIGSTDKLHRLAVMESSSEAINGGDSACVLAYLHTRLTPAPPAWAVLLLNCGLHDIRTDPLRGSRQVEPAAYAENLDAILGLVALASRSVVWLRTTPVSDSRHQRLNPEFHRFNADVDRYNQIADRIMDQAGIPKIDLYAFTRSLSVSLDSLDSLYSDHVHFVEPVQRLQAAYIAGWLDARSFA